MKIANILSAEIMGSGAKDNCSLNGFCVIPPEKPCVISDILWSKEGWKYESVRQEEWSKPVGFGYLSKVSRA